MALKKPSDFFQQNDIITEEAQEVPQQKRDFVVSSTITETFDRFKENFEKLDNLRESVESFSEQLSDKVSKSDLENAMMSHLMVIDENFKSFRKQIKGLNKRDLTEIASAIEELVEYIEEELPKYKKAITNNEIKYDSTLQEFKELVAEDVNLIKDIVDEKIESLNEQIDKTNQNITEVYEQAKNTSDKYNKLYNIIETRSLKEESKLEEYSSIIESIQEEVKSFQEYIQSETNTTLEKLTESIDDKIASVSNQLSEDVEKKLKYVNSLRESIDNNLTDIKTDIVVNEKHIKQIESYIQENHKELVSLREEVFAEIEQIPVGDIEYNIQKLQEKIDFIKETYSQFNTEKLVREVISEGLLNEPPSTDNKDPLTPLDKEYVTLEQLQQHYRLFLNRIQQQLSTLGGGGETRLEFLDDVDRQSAKINGRFLKYDAASGKWVGAVGGGGGGTQTLDDTLGYGNTSSLGIKVGVSTFNNVIIGGGTTDLLVNGDARVTGILTVGTASVTIDGQNTVVHVGSAATITVDGFNIGNSLVHSSGITVGLNTLHTSGLTVNNLNVSGVITATQIYGNLNGNSTTSGYATSAGIASDLTSTSNINTTGIITASSFSGSGTNLTSLNASNLSTGVVPGSRINSASGDFTVGTNLYVNGTLSVGGTTIVLNTTELQVKDKDIVVGYTTDVNNNDVSDDNTANHGGISVASTVGSPLINIPLQVGVNSNPSTYKQFMWIKNGNYSGMGTDAWVSNYPISIGNTSSVLNGSRLTVGTGFTVFSTYLDATDIKSRNILSTGIVTAYTFIPSSGYYQAADGTNSFYVYSSTGNVAFQGTIGVGQINNASGYKSIEFSASSTPTVLIPNSLNVTGITTSVGGFVGNLTGTATTATNLSDAANITTGTINTARLSGTYNISISGNSATSGYATTAGIATVSQGLTGVPDINVGIVTSTKLVVNDGGTFTGIVTAATFNGQVNAGVGTITTLTSTDITASTINATSNGLANKSVLAATGTPRSTASSYGLLGVGPGGLGFSDTNIVAHYYNSVNSYSQMVIQNNNSGTSASADIIVNNDKDTGTQYYGDFGVNSTTFTGSGPFDDPNGVYVYSAGGTLSVGTNDAFDYKVATGSAANTPVTRLTIKAVTGNVGVGSTLPTSILDVTGNAKVSGVITATSFVKSGGTSSQFLKADGSVDSNTYLTTLTDTLNTVTNRGNSTTNGISVGVLTATSGNFAGIITSTGAVISGVVTATKFVGDGSLLTGVVAASGVTIQNAGSTVGTASTINFSTGLSATFSSGIATITNSGVTALATSGNGISVNASTGSVTVSSNATNANTPSTIVYRDSSGNFSSNVITSNLITNAGTASTAPISINSGTLLTTAAAGAIEYNGTTFFSTPSATSGRGLMPSASYYRLNDNLAGTTALTAQKVLGVGLTVTASTVYAFEYVFIFSKTAGTTSHSVVLNFGGTATFNNAIHTALETSTATANLAASSLFVTSMSSNLSYAMGTTQTISLSAIGKGTFSVNASGTVIPQYTLSANPGGAYSTLAGSYIMIYPVGSAGAATSIGAWA